MHDMESWWVICEEGSIADLYIGVGWPGDMACVMVAHAYVGVSCVINLSLGPDLLVCCSSKGVLVVLGMVAQ